jgi:hypothetical protein
MESMTEPKQNNDVLNACYDDPYTIMKNQFKEHSFKLVDTTEYGTWENNSWIIRKKGDLQDAFCEMKYMREKNGCKRKCF